MYSLIAIDMDGTLLNDWSDLPDNTYSAVEYLNNNNIQLVLATGRPLLGVLDIYEQLGLESPIIASNGAMAYLDIKSPPIFNNTMSISQAKHVLSLNEKWNLTACMWLDGKLYVSELNQYAFDYASITGITPILLDEVNWDEHITGPTKFVMRDTLERIEQLKKEAAVTLAPKLTALTTRADFLEIFSSGISKGTALKRLAEILNIKTENIISVGDGENDIDMLKVAGLSIAVNNAPLYVQQHADIIGCSNNQGILNYIVEKILKPSK